MVTSTTTCSHSIPLQFDGTPPVSSLDYFQYSSSTCLTLSPDPATSTISVDLSRGASSENPLITQDSGSLVFGLALILFLLAFAVLGTIFTTPSRRHRS